MKAKLCRFCNDYTVFDKDATSCEECNYELNNDIELREQLLTREELENWPMEQD